jgi:hypothetical protein
MVSGLTWFKTPRGMSVSRINSVTDLVIGFNPLLHASIEKSALKVSLTARSLCVIEG